MARDVAKNPRVTLVLETKVEHVIFDNDKSATGILLSNGTIVEGDDVVLSGGVFGSFELLVRSGIGKESDIANTKYPKQKDPVFVNNNIGKGYWKRLGSSLLAQHAIKHRITRNGYILTERQRF